MNGKGEEVVYLQILCRYSPEGTEENLESLGSPVS
jgi:hypothetical protein